MTKSQKPSFNAGDHIYLIDGSGYIFRAYHALPPLSRPSDGLPVGAVHGFCQMLWKLLQDTSEGDKPTHLAVIFDAARKNFRNDIYEQYKAHRPEAPEDLIPQFPLIRQATKAFHVPALEQEGYEADDLIATYTRQAVERGAIVTIVSSDKDLMQLIKPGVTLLDTMKNNKVIGPDQVLEKFGVPPEKVVDVQSLAGDSSDNVPGVPGIGIKTAAQLIQEFGTLDQLLENAHTIKQNKRRENLIEFAEQARISRELVRLKDDVNVDVALEDLTVTSPDAKTLISFLQEMEFNKLTTRIADKLGAEVPEVETHKAHPPKAPQLSGALSEDKTSKSLSKATPQHLAAQKHLEITKLKLDRSAYETVNDLAILQTWISAAQDQGYVAFDTETTSLDALQGKLVGFSLALAPGKACYVPLGHTSSGDLLDLDGAASLQQIPFDKALPLLKTLLEDQSVLKIGQNIKYDCLVLKRHNIAIAPIDDTMLISYVLDAGLGGNGMDELSERHLNHKCITFKEVTGSGKSQVTFDKVALDRATEYAAEDADVTLRLWHSLKPRLVAERKTTVYETLDRPLLPVLAEMEYAGIKVDRAVLARLSGQFAKRLEELEIEVHKLAGENFNVGSPKQLGDILFGKLGLPGGKKTSTGAYSTGASVLDDLAANETLSDEARKLVTTLLEWRQLSKLKSTYTDALPEYIHPDTGRIHTSYAMAATATGRLASTDPNLQNIPIRSKEGREIRTAFIAEKDHILISADYSQIELRILAHIADIDALKNAFQEGLDIHAMTASEMFGVPIEGMDPMIRRKAKAINFGIIYGISAFGLANQLSISKGEAGEYIKTYFKRFPGIRDYMENMKKQVHENGCVHTIFGRTIHYPEIKTKNKQQQAFFERAAINAPIQGSAADIIRRAMIRIPDALKANGLSSAKMLLQVHDELIIEAPHNIADKTMKIITSVMEKACEPVLNLAVPLQVEAKAALNWDEAH